jgi:hypothetical protein
VEEVIMDYGDGYIEKDTDSRIKALARIDALKTPLPRILYVGFCTCGARPITPYAHHEMACPKCGGRIWLNLAYDLSDAADRKRFWKKYCSGEDSFYLKTVYWIASSPYLTNTDFARHSIRWEHKLYKRNIIFTREALS